MGRDVGGSGAPFQVRSPSPGAAAAARRIHQHSVIKPFGGNLRERTDVGVAAATRSPEELRHGADPDIKGVDPSLRTEQAGELEGFPSGSGARVEPGSAGREGGAGEDELGAEILNLESALAEPLGGGEVGFRQHFAGAGLHLRCAHAPPLLEKFRPDALAGFGLQPDPQRCAAVQRFKVGWYKRGGAVCAKPVREQFPAGAKMPGARRCRLRGRWPPGDQGFPEAAGRRQVGREPGDSAHRFIRRPSRKLRNPWPVAQGGVKQFAVKAPVAGAKFAVPQGFLDARREIAVRWQVRLKAAPQAQESPLLVRDD